MPTRDGHARWEGGLREGAGNVDTASGALSSPYSASSRFEDGSGTNPEELLGAAHASCFSMALTNILESAGHDPRYVDTTAKVTLKAQDGGFVIPTIELITEASVPGIDDADFQGHAETAKKECPLSKALAGPEISLTATLAT
jgi:osmotically inducible protein OsmC